MGQDPRVPRAAIERAVAKEDDDVDFVSREGRDPEISWRRLSLEALWAADIVGILVRRLPAGGPGGAQAHSRQPWIGRRRSICL